MRYAIIFSAALLVAGCAPISEVRGLRVIQKDTLTGAKPEDVSYSEHLRCFVKKEHFAQHAPKKVNGESETPPIEIPLLDANGQKIRTKGQVDESILANGDVKMSGGEKVATAAVMLWAVPVGISMTIVENILGLPLAPYVFYIFNKTKSDSYLNYMSGDLAYAQGKFKDSRGAYLRSEKAAASMAQHSDIYLKIGRTYELEGKKELSTLYYRKFLDYSLAQYPEYFSRQSPALKNDPQHLKSSFEFVECKLANGAACENDPAGAGSLFPKICSPGEYAKFGMGGGVICCKEGLICD